MSRLARKFVKPDLSEAGRRVKEITEQLGRAAGEAAAVYNEIGPNGRKLSHRDEVKAREQLFAITNCLRDIHNDEDVIVLLAADGRRTGRNTDLRPTIALMRMMQRGLGLALSGDPLRRQKAMPVTEIARFAGPVARFWREL